MANLANLKVRLLHDTVVAPADEPRGENKIGRAGEIHELDRWTAMHLCQCHPEFPRAELSDGKKWADMQSGKNAVKAKE